MCEHDKPWIAIAVITDIGRRKSFMHFTASLPGYNLDWRLLRDVLCEIFVGNHDYGVCAALARNVFHDKDGIR